MRTLVGNAVYVHQHPWLPTGRIFSPTQATEDPKLFDGDHLRSQVRVFVLEEIGRDWDRSYPDWPHWATVYLAGGEASRWWGSHAAHGEGEEADDLDVLVAVDFDAVRAAHPHPLAEDDHELAAYLTGFFREGFDRRNERAQIPGVIGTYGMTAYVNPANTQDISVLHPYAAYDISHDRWAVRPVETAADWSAASLPEYTWDALEGLLAYIDAIREMPEPLRTREGAHLFDDLHSDRTEAFGEHGEGVFDPANVLWKALDLHPSQPLEFLVGCKRRLAGSAIVEAPSIEDPLGQPTAAVRYVAPDNSPEPEGMMVAIVPPKSVIKKLLVDDGEAADNLHITLVYLGHTSEHTQQQVDDVVEMVTAWAETQEPFECKVQGAGTFNNHPDHVMLALVDAPALTRMHISLVDYLKQHGYDPHEDHSFTPHITLKYDKYHVRFLPKIEPTTWQVKQLWTAVGGRWESVRLGG